MLKSLRIRNYRGFEDLTIERLGRINLITGRNNVGKTSLLESLYLLSGGANPQSIIDANVVRGSVAISGSPDSALDNIAKPLFFNLNMKNAISICAESDAERTIQLEIMEERPNMIQFSIQNNTAETKNNLPVGPGLHFQFFDNTTTSPVEGRIQITRNGAHISAADASPPFYASYPSTMATHINPTEIASLLGHLRVHKQDKFVLEALQVIEPSLVSIEDNSSGGSPRIWGDIGLPELLPLEAMGGGMRRLAQLAIMFASSPLPGIVLIDEIENGIHYSVMPKIWKVIDTAARKFQIQIFATTHSWECVEAAYNALDLEETDFLLHRIERDTTGCRCVTIPPSSIESIVQYNMEIR